MPQEPQLDRHRELALIRTRLPVIIIVTVLAALAAFGFSSVQSKVYEARASLIVGTSINQANPDLNGLLASQQLAATYATIATTRPVLDAVIKKLGLPTTAGELQRNITASTGTDSTFLTVTVHDGDPTLAMNIANTLADELINVSPSVSTQNVDIRTSVDAYLKATEAQITSAQAQAVTLSGNQNRTPAQDAALAALQTDLVNLRATYATLLAFSSAASANLLSVIEPAVAPDTPISPRPLLNVLLAAVLSLLLSGAVILIAAYLDDTIKNPADVEDVVALPTLGTVGRMTGGRGKSEIYRLATLLYPRSAVAESYRMLRSNLEFARVDRPIHTILVTSSLPGEGKTVTAANLAIAFALEGRRVLLVDADLRKPSVHTLFDVPNTQGLTTMLRSDSVTLESVAHTNEQERLKVLTSGPLPPNPAEMLGSQRMLTVLQRLQASQDVLIIDSPPLRAVTDAAILSAFVDGTLLVIDASKSRRPAVRLGREALNRVNAQILGVVLNRVPRPPHTNDPMFDGYQEATDEPAPPSGSWPKWKTSLEDRLKGRVAGSSDRE
jgi:succinoglycan biosynthesis transport protein ExoP